MASVATFSWREIPLLRLLLPFLVGIGLAWWTTFEWATILFDGFFFFLTILLLFILFRSLSLINNRIVGVAILAWFLCFGYWRATIYNQRSDDNHFSQYISLEKDSTYWWYAEIEEIIPKQKSLRASVRIYAYAREQNKFNACKGKMLLYLAPDSSALDLKVGSEIIFSSNVNSLRAPLNPDAFDFAAYKSKENVFHQARIDGEAWQLYKNKWTIRGQALEWRQQLMKILRQHLASGSNELAVAAALILGNKNELGDDVRNAYTNTGAVHVLAVSGLHVGFIAWGLGYLLSIGPFRKKRWKWPRLVLSITGVWAFALVTGLSPSVMRAASMFSFLLVGNALSRRANIYNILAASAFFLLLFNPFLVLNLGFQLSYLAVLGIVFFQPRIYKSIYPPNKILDYLWKLSSVALAAQLATLPLSLFYFHQFPVYFLLSGIVVVTAASFILGLGVLLFMTSFIPGVATVVGFVLSTVLWLNNAFIFALNGLPGGLITGIWISFEIMLLLYLTIVFLMRFFYNKKAIESLIGLAVLNIALGLNVYTQINLSNQKEWIIYHQYKATIIDAFDGHTRYSFSTLKEDDPLLSWGVQPHRERQRIKKVVVNKPDGNNWLNQQHFLGFYNKKMLVIDPTFIYRNKEKSIVVDIILLKNAPPYSLKNLAKYVEATTWVIDGSTPPSIAKKWLIEAKNLNINIHWTAKKGAFILKF